MVDDANVLPGVTAAQKASALEENERTLGAQESVSEVVSEVFSGYVCHSIEAKKYWLPRVLRMKLSIRCGLLEIAAVA